MRQAYATHLAIVTGLLIAVVAVGFAVAQSPELRQVAAWTAMAMPHLAQPDSRCDGCHGIGGARPYPVRHLGWSNASCLRCHPAAAPGPDASRD